jgi:hypothetical protein
MIEPRRDGYEQLVEEFGRRLEAAGTRPIAGHRSRRAVASAVVLGVIAAGALALSGIGDGGGRLDVVAQARAALAPTGQIVHLVTTAHTEMRGGSHSEIVGREAEENAPRVAERWSTTKPLRWRVASSVPIVTAHGTSIGPVQRSYGEGTEELYVQPLNTLNVRAGVSEGSPWVSMSAGPLGSDPVARIHAMLEAGQLREAGGGIVDGHAVKRLIGRELDAPGGTSHQPWPVEYDVNPETFAPVRFTVEEVGVRIPGNTGVPTVLVDVNAYEVLPLNERTASLLSIHPTGNPIVERHTARD